MTRAAAMMLFGMGAAGAGAFAAGAAPSIESKGAATALNFAAVALIVGGLAAALVGGWKEASGESTNPTRRRACPTGSVVQTIIFPKSRFTVDRAKAWARRHGYKASKVDASGGSIRLRQRAPAGFARLRTISMGPAQAVVGWRRC